MLKWLVTALVFLVLIVLGATVQWWLSPLLSLAEAQSDAIQGLTGLAQLALWVGAGAWAIVKLWLGLKERAVPVQVTVGKKGQAVVDSVVGGHVLGPGAEFHVHEGIPRADEEALLESYLSRLVGEVRWLNLSGVDPALTTDAARARLSLAQVYTELDTLEGDPSEDKAYLSRMETEDGTRESRRVSVVKAVNKERCLVLLGDPGSGKSTFVNFVTLCLAGERLGLGEVNLNSLGEDWGSGWFLPVRVVLRDFVARGLPAGREKATGDHLRRFLQAELGETLSDFAPLLCKRLQEQGGMVLLDGFDEVPEAEQRRQQVMDVVEGFVRDFPRCRFLLTSRTYAYQRQNWRLPGFAERVLLPFSDEQIDSFVDRWYQHVSTLRRGEISSDDAQGKATLLKYAIANTSGIRELAGRPLLLTLMASLHAWRGGTLPDKRELLYNDTLDLLLNVWEQPKTVRDAQGNEKVVQEAVQEWLRAPREKLLKALERLGYESHARQSALEGTANVPEMEFVQALWEIRENPDLRWEKIVEYIRDRAGLLVPYGVGMYTFPHRTFQEYLAARYLTEENWPEVMAARVLEEPEKWREVALLAAAKAARGASYAVWGLVEALAPEHSPKTPDVRRAWAALIGATALVENDLHENVPNRHKDKVLRLKDWLVAAMEQVLLPAVERAAAGRVLGKLGDDRPGVTGILRVEGRPPLPDMELCYVPAGPFWMGEGEDEHLNECLDYPYWMGRYPVTNAQFRVFVDDPGGYQDNRWWTEAGLAWRKDRKGSREPGEPYNLPNHPVVRVTWYEALAHARWLTERMGEWAEEPIEVRLPSEAEWEKAARGGLQVPEKRVIICLGEGGQEALPAVADGPVALRDNPSPNRRYPWQGEIEPNLANYAETSIGTTSAVGCFPGGAGPYGCEELSGNVGEWTRSIYKDYPYRPKDGREDLESEALRVLRGGSFLYGKHFARCADRLHYLPLNRIFDLGFRVVVVSPIFPPLFSDTLYSGTLGGGLSDDGFAVC